MNHINLDCGTNYLSSERTASEIARSIATIDIPYCTKKRHLNSKFSQLNSRLIHMCTEQNRYIEHTNSIQPENHLNESKVHFNKYGAMVFAKNISRFFSE